MPDPANQLVIPVIALLEIEHAHQRGRFPLSSREVEAALKEHNRCECMDIGRGMLAYYRAELEMHDALYVCAAKFLEQTRPGEHVAIVTRDEAIETTGVRSIW